MPTLICDFETYYDDQYSLKKMPSELYVMHKNFRVHGASIKLDNDLTVWMEPRELSHFFGGLDWDKTIFVAHNASFDGSILVWRYGYMPKLFVDTMGLANQFIKPFTGQSSLHICAGYLGMQGKSDVLLKTKGMTLEQIQLYPILYNNYMKYAINDNLVSEELYKRYFFQLSSADVILMDWTIRNYVRGRLRLNREILKQAVDEIEEERNLLAKEAGILDKAILRSTKKLEAYLASLGIEVDQKNGKNGEIPALSKKDPFVINALATGTDQVKAIIRARLINSSSGDLTKAKRLIATHDATRGKMLLPTVYSAAHTGRIGGTNGINVTNIKHGSIIRKAINPPAGKVMIEADSSQGEARICAWLAGCEKLLEVFRDPKRDVYCEYGNNVIYRSDPTVVKGDPRRQVCKVEVLGLQYGLGKDKLRHDLLAKGIDVSEDEAAQHVYGYRNAYPEILNNGKEFVDRFKWCLITGKTDNHKGFILSPEGLVLLSGRMIYYPQLHVDKTSDELLYYNSKYKTYNKLYAGSMNENLCQSTLHDIVKLTLVRFREDTISFLYDAVTRLVDENVAEEELEKTKKSLNTVPKWAEGLPLASDGKPKWTW